MKLSNIESWFVARLLAKSNSLEEKHAEELVKEAISDTIQTCPQHQDH